MNHRQTPRNNNNFWAIPIPNGETVGYLTKMAVRYPNKNSKTNQKPIYYFILDDPIKPKYQAYFCPPFVENMIKGDDLLGELVIVYRNDRYIDISRVGEPIEIE